MLSRMRKIVLASASKWRKELLKKAGVRFIVDVSGHTENLKQKMSPIQLVRKLALEKARVVAERHKDAIIIGADTVVSFRGKVIGKPKNAVEARKILTALSGNQHSLITGFVILDTKTQRIVIRDAETKVWFRKLSPAEINAYAKKKEILTVAGAYAIQGGGVSFAKWVEGDFYNIVGLPVAAVIEELRKFTSD